MSSYAVVFCNLAFCHLLDAVNYLICWLLNVKVLKSMVSLVLDHLTPTPCQCPLHLGMSPPSPPGISMVGMPSVMENASGLIHDTPYFSRKAANSNGRWFGVQYKSLCMYVTYLHDSICLFTKLNMFI